MALKGMEMAAGAVQWSDVLTIVGPCIIVAIGAVLWVMKLVSDERRERIRADDIEREQRMVTIEAERGRRIALTEELAEFREKTAREMVTMDMFQRLEERIVDAINRLGDRIDRVVEGPPQRGPRTTRT